MSNGGLQHAYNVVMGNVHHTATVELDDLMAHSNTTSISNGASIQAIYLKRRHKELNISFFWNIIYVCVCVCVCVHIRTCFRTCMCTYVHR